MAKHNFDEVIDKGLSDGVKSLEKKKDIENIFGEYRASLENVLARRCSKKVSVQFHPPQGKTMTLVEAFAPIRSWAQKEEAPSTSLSANVDGSNEWFEILRYEVDPVTGYPCSIISGDNNVSCSNEDQLVTCLENVAAQRGMYIADKLDGVLQSEPDGTR